MRTATLVQSRSKSEQKKTLEMIKSIPTAITGQLKFPQIKQQTETIVYKVASIGDLVSGTNIGAILPVKIVMHLDKPSEVPMGCLIVDSKSTFAVASFYGTNKTLTENQMPTKAIKIYKIMKLSLTKKMIILFKIKEISNRLIIYNMDRTSNPKESIQDW